MDRALASPQAEFGVVADLEKGVALAGFKTLSPTEFQELTQKVDSITAGRLILPLDSVWGLMAYTIGLSFEETHGLLVSLAEADRRGEFEAAYAALLPQGLDKIEGYFLARGSALRPGEDLAVEKLKVKAHLRALAKEYVARLTRDAGPLAPQALEWVVIVAKGKAFLA